MNTDRPLAVISALLQRVTSRGPEVFLQERFKPKTSPTYSGLWEIPAGKIEKYENVYDTLRREVKEECNLDIVRIVDDFQSPSYCPTSLDETFVFRPFLCQQALRTNQGLPWLGFVFLCEVAGEVRLNPEEARHPAWFSIPELRDLIRTQPEKIFPLQLPVLDYYVQQQTQANKKG